ncbi:MAG: polysaccharide biosynthesis/export family protein [Bacteroidales bacterium]|nr:polysaccharide biosynthesis/export family protein [Bacteroidales bacterium]
MINTLYSLFKTATLLIVLSLFFSSCISQKEIKYLQPSVEDSPNRSEFSNADIEDYRFNYGDNIYINIRSLDQKASDLFNSTSGSRTTNSYNDASIYLNSYTVDVNGEIDFPLIGKIKLVNLTQSEAIKQIQKAVDVYLKETTVIVKLVNFNITFVGEVKKPGEYKIYQDKISLFEAISLAGDISDYGNKKAVKLLRSTNAGHEMITLDLTSENILESPYFYLKPNDVIYIEPLPSKQYGFATFPYSLLFSTISSVILIITFLQK